MKFVDRIKEQEALRTALASSVSNFTPQELREYEASKVAYRDIKNSIDTAKREGLAEGKNKQQEETALKMLSDGMDIDLIAKYSGLSKEQIERLVNQ